MSDQHYPSGGYGAPAGYPQQAHDPYAPQPQSGWAPGTGPQGPPGPQGPHGGGPGGPRPNNNLPIVVAIAVLAIVAVAAIAFVVIGGGDDDDGTAGDTTEQDQADEPVDQGTAAPAGVTLADLEPALLTTADVPAGYEQVPWEAGSDEDTLGPDDIDASEECREAFARLAGADGAREETGAEFESALDGGGVSHTLSLAVPDDVTVSEVADAIGTCGTFGYDDGASTGEITMASEPVDGIGDEALGISLLVSTEAEGVPVSLEMYGIVWDRSGVHSSVQFTGGIDMANYTEGGPVEGVPADRDAVHAAAQTVDARIQEVLGAA